MSRVIFMCGPSGSGKSTYAKRLEADGMVRLSFDVEGWRRGIVVAPFPPGVREEIETSLRARLLELVAAGTDVVLDFSFWSREMRDDYRRLLAPTGITPETIYLATDRDTVLARVRARRTSHPDDYQLDPELAAHYVDHFEPPTPEEGPLTVVDDSLAPVSVTTCRNEETLAAASGLFNRYRHHYGQPPDRDGITLGWLTSMVESGLLTVYTASVGPPDAPPVGLATGHPVPASLSLRRSWQLRDLYVDSAWRRRGVAAALVGTVRAAAVAASASRLSLVTEPDNDDALGLYRRLGFTPVEGLTTLSLDLER